MTKAMALKMAAVRREQKRKAREKKKQAYAYLDTVLRTPWLTETFKEFAIKGVMGSR